MEDVHGHQSRGRSTPGEQQPNNQGRPDDRPRDDVRGVGGDIGATEATDRAETAMHFASLNAIGSHEVEVARQLQRLRFRFRELLAREIKLL